MQITTKVIQNNSLPDNRILCHGIYAEPLVRAAAWKKLKTNFKVDESVNQITVFAPIISSLFLLPLGSRLFGIMTGNHRPSDPIKIMIGPGWHEKVNEGHNFILTRKN